MERIDLPRLLGTTLLLFLSLRILSNWPVRYPDDLYEVLRLEQKHYNATKSSVWGKPPTHVGKSLHVPKDVYQRIDQLYSLPVGKGAAFQNFTGTFHGDWFQTNISERPIHRISNNTRTSLGEIISTETGKATINVYEYSNATLNSVLMALRITNQEGTQAYDLEFEGDRIDELDSFLLTTTITRNFSGTDTIPWMLKGVRLAKQPLRIGEEVFDKLRNKSLNRIEARISRLENTGKSSLFSTAKSDQSSCSLLAYLRLKRSPYDNETLSAIYNEYFHPEGIPLPPLPPMHMDAVFYSPNCNLGFTLKNAEGASYIQYEDYLLHLASLFVVLVCLQVYFSWKELNHLTSSYAYRLSYLTVAMQTSTDSQIAIGFTTLSLSMTKGYLIMYTLGFLFIFLSAFPSARSFFMIVEAQGLIRPSAPAQAVAAEEDEQNQEGEEHEQEETVNNEVNNNRHSRRIVSVIFTLYYVSFFVMCYAFVFVLTRPHKYAFRLLMMLLFFMNSYWIPQICRNISLGSSRSFSWSFIVGMSVCRLGLPLIILLLCEPVLGFAPNYKASLAIVAYVFVQVIILLLQESFGPRFFLPSFLFSSKSIYDYHPVIHTEDLETLVSNSNTCPICMQTIELPSEGSALHPSSIMLRRNYMLTPCHHLYHRQCLMQWMELHSICPMCRSRLPPI